MKKEHRIFPYLSIPTSIMVIVFLLIHKAPADKILGGRLSGVHILILIFPVIVFLLSVLLLFTSRFNLKINRKTDLIYCWIEDHLVLEFFLFFLFLDVLMFVSLPMNSIWVTVSQKIFLDVILVFFILVFFAIPKFVHNLKTFFVNTRGKQIWSLLIFVALFLLILVNLKLTGLSAVIHPLKYFGAGAPIIEIQGYIAIITGLLLALFIKVIKPKSKALLLLEVILLITLPITAFFFWNSAATPTNFFMRYLNPGTIAPYSDSRVYDLNGLGLVYGQGVGFGFPTQKPFYSFFVGILHLLFGQDYFKILTGQLFVFSLLPVMFFLISKHLFNRAVGFSGAILLIFNEYNLIILSSRFTMNSVKMLMTDTFFTLFVLLLVLFTFFWINNPASKKFAILTGVCLAIGILIRIQMVAFIFVYFLAIMFFPRYIKIRFIILFSFFSIGLLSGLLPWMVRNYVRTGQFVIEQPEYVNFAFIPTSSFVHSSEEVFQTDKEFSRLVSSDLTSYIRSASSHFNNSILSSFYQIPTNYGHFYNLDESVSVGNQSYPYPYADLSGKQKFIWYVNLFVFFCGVVFSWYYFKWKGIFPFIFYLFFIATISISGYSGWRFVHPVDWVVLLYWTAGVFGFIKIFSSGFSLKIEDTEFLPKKYLMPEKGIIPTFIFAMLIGFTLPLAEMMIMPVFSPQTKTEVFNQVFPVFSNSKTELITFFQDSSSVMESGKGLYPIYVGPGDDIEWKLRVGFAPYPAYYSKHIDYQDERIQNRLLKENSLFFLTLVKTNVQEVYLFNPRNNISINSGENVIIIGCDRGDFIEAYWVKIGDSIIENTNGIPQTCVVN